MNSKRNTRIKDIAEKAGVSIGTVDRVLHERGEVSEETRKRVLQIIKELDYHPNILASSLASKKNIVFATLIPKAISQESYWAKPQLGIEKAIEELQQYGIRINQFFFEMDKLGSYTVEAEKLIASNPDGVMVAPWIQKEATDLVRKLEEKNIPYIFIDSILPSAHPISFVVQSSFQSGFVAAKLLDYGTPEDGLLLLIHIENKINRLDHIIEREKGFLNYFEKHPGKNQRIVKLDISGGAEEIKLKLSQLGIDICSVNGMFVTNSKVHLAAECFKDLCTPPKIVGYDLITKNLELLRKGKIDFLICQKPESQGFTAINLLFDHMIKKEKIKKENFIPIDIITAENIDYYSSF